MPGFKPVAIKTLKLTLRTPDDNFGHRLTRTNTDSSAVSPAVRLDGSHKVVGRSRKVVILARELMVFLGFCLFTALLTWPYVTRMRDAVVDKGDPYLMA